MPAAIECPREDELLAVFDDRGPFNRREELESHVEACPQCQERLDRDEADLDSLRRVGKRVGDPTIVPAETTLVDVVERILDGPSNFTSDGVRPEELYFLRPSDRPDLLGTLGKYEVQEVIGQGGMGVVIKAYEPALHRLVAIKVLAAAIAGSATARQRFTREARAAAAVCHDHIVVMHGVDDIDGLPYLVMQYISGESLQARLDRAGPLELTEIVRIGLQTASALAAAHAQGLIHRDIKPANLLLENGVARVKITDFGLARTTDDVHLTQPGVVAGTPEYMSPEQARGEVVDHRADLFSLGSVLYAMCTGMPPFRGTTPLAVIRQVNDQQPKPIRTLNPEVPAWLDAFIARLMAKNPDERMQSAGEVATLLEGYLAHLRQPVTVAAPSLPFDSAEPARVERTPNRKRRVTLMLAGMAACVAVAFIAYWILQLDAPLQGADEAVRRFEKLGAKTRRDDRLPGRPVVSIRFTGTQATNDDIKGLGLLTNVQIVNLEATQVTDDGLKELAPLIQMRELYLGRTSISDAGVKNIAHHAQLQNLGLESTKITDACMSDLSGLTKLRYLNLGRNGISDANIKQLAPLTEMRMLCLYSTGVTDAGLQELNGFDKLEKLMLGDTLVTDNGIKHLANLKNLKTLEVARTDVTKKGLDEFKAVAPAVVVDPPQGDLPARPGTLNRGWLVVVGILVAVLIGIFAVMAVLLRFRRTSARNEPRSPIAADAESSESLQISMACSDCSRRLKVRATLAGKKAKCPHCGAVTLVPSIQSAPPARLPATTAPSVAIQWKLLLIALAFIGLAPFIAATAWFAWPRQPAEASSFLNVGLGSEPVADVEESGFSYQEYMDDAPFRWTDGQAKLTIPIRKGDTPEAVRIKLHTWRLAEVQIRANQQELFNGKLQIGRWDKVLDLRNIAIDKQLDIEIISDTYLPFGKPSGKMKKPSDDPRTLGVLVWDVRLLAKHSEQAAPLALKAEGFKEFFESFRNEAEVQNLRIIGPDKEECVRFQKDGLRITLPKGVNGLRQGTGVSYDTPIKGDFEVTVNFEILNEPAPEDSGIGGGIGIAIELESEVKKRTTFNRVVKAKGGPHLTTWVKIDRPDNPESNLQRFPGDAKKGQLRIVRTGDSLAYSFAEHGAAFGQPLTQCMFGDEDVKYVRIVGTTGGPKAALESRVTDLRIRTRGLPDPVVPEVQTTSGNGMWIVGVAAAVAFIGVVGGAVLLVRWLRTGRKR